RFFNPAPFTDGTYFSLLLSCSLFFTVVLGAWQKKVAQADTAANVLAALSTAAFLIAGNSLAIDSPALVCITAGVVAGYALGRRFRSWWVMGISLLGGFITVEHAFMTAGFGLPSVTGVTMLGLLAALGMLTGPLADEWG